jgi:hypothetical protein
MPTVDSGKQAAFEMEFVQSNSAHCSRHTIIHGTGLFLCLSVTIFFKWSDLNPQNDHWILLRCAIVFCQSVAKFGHYAANLPECIDMNKKISNRRRE